MELSGEKPRVILKFNDLYEVSAGRNAAEQQPDIIASEKLGEGHFSGNDADKRYDNHQSGNYNLIMAFPLLFEQLHIINKHIYLAPLAASYFF